MELPNHTPETGMLSELLQDWCEAMGALGATLAQYPPGAACPCPVAGELSGKPRKTYRMKDGCPLLAHDSLQVIAGVGPPPTGGVCLTCHLASGGLLALQVTLPAAALPPVESRLKLVSDLGAPMLLLAAEILDRRNTGPAGFPPPWLSAQMQVYGREVRQLYLAVARLQEQLKEMGEQARSELLQAIQGQEDEREWLALEVHDRVAQTLASIFQQLQTIEGLARSSPEVRQAAVRGSRLSRDAIREARSLMNDLRPPVLEELGLVPLMEEELQQLEEDTKCKASFRPVYPLRPSREMELIVYRVFHEALINIRRHAQARRISVALRCDQDGVRLEVRDDGVGFDVADALARRRIGGLVSMRRRAELAGGRCELESAPGAGTRVILQTPLTPPPRGGARLMDGGGRP